MPTRLSLFCERFIEAGWLAALIFIPLFFNFYNNKSFDPPKVILLRSLAWVMVLAFVVWALERRAWAGHLGDRWVAALVRKPLVFPLLLLAFVYVLTSLTSVLPSISLWGGYNRRQETYTVMAYLTLFLLTYRFLCRRDQLERLLEVLLMASWAVVLYAWLQFFGLDPVNWEQPERLFSTLGNPVFLAAYLVMVVPLTLARLLQMLTLPRGRRLLAGVYGFLLAMQLLVIVLTESRGPFLGLLAGLFAFFLLLASIRGWKRMLVAVVASALAIATLLVALNLPNTPLAPLKAIGLLERLGQVLSGQSSATVRSRVLIWQATTKMVSEEPLRFLVGYGPETFDLVYYRYASPELILERGPLRNPDRAHNEVWDTWASTGLLGLAALFFLYGAVFYHGLTWLGLVSKRRQRAVFWFLLGAGGLGGVAVAIVLGGTPAFLGIGLGFGFLAGLVSYPVVRTLVWGSGVPVAQGETRDPVIVAILAAVVAHLVEVQFGFPVVGTRSLFWIYLALMVAASSRLQEEPVTTAAVSRGRRRRSEEGRGPSSRTEDQPLSDLPMLYGCLMALILVTLILDLIPLDFDPARHGLPVLAVLTGTWLLPAMIALAQLASLGSQSVSRWMWLVTRYGVASLGMLAGLMTVHVILTESLGVSSELYRVALYFAYVLLGMVIIAVILVRREKHPRMLRWTQKAWLYPLVAVAVGWGVWNTNLSLSEGDFYFKLGLAVDEQNRIELALSLYERAADAAPSQDHYHRAVGEAALIMMSNATQEQAAASWFEKSRDALLKAQHLNPLNPDNYVDLGRLYLAWSPWAKDPSERAVWLQQAWVYYRIAIERSPQVHRARHQGEVVMTLVRLGDTYLELNDLSRPVEIYEQALALDPNSFAAHKGLALTYQQAGEIDKALAQAEAALALASEAERESLERLIAELETAQRQ